MRSCFPLLRSGVFLVSTSLVFASACRDAPQQESQQQPTYMPTATVRDLMLAVVDPSADVVWDAVRTIVGPSGTEDIAPHTDEEWETVRHGALRLAEATNLLMVPGRHVARPGEKSVAPWVEEEPENMEAAINKDRQVWNGRARALLDASLEALQAIDAKDSEKLFDIGEQIQTACENCHIHYWYPKEAPPGFEFGSR